MSRPQTNGSSRTMAPSNTNSTMNKRPFQQPKKDHKKWESEEESENKHVVQAKVNAPSAKAISKITMPPAKAPKRKEVASSSEEEDSETDSQSEDDSDESQDSDGSQSSANESGSDASESENEDESASGSESEEQDSDNSGSEEESENDDEEDEEEEEESEEDEEEVQMAKVKAHTPVEKTHNQAASNKEDSGDSNDTTVFVGNLAWDATEKDITNFFKPCGAVRQVRIIMDRSTNRPKGFGYVEFEKVSGVTNAMQQNGKDLFGRPVRIDRANAPPSRQDGNASRTPSPHHKSNPTPTLFVANLSFNVSESQLSDAFSKFGPVLLSRIPTGHDQKPKGFGYVQFSNVEAAQAAMSAPRMEIEGRFVRLDYDSGSSERKKKF